MVHQNLTNIRERIKAAAQRSQRNPSQIILVCVTKEAQASQIYEAIEWGVTDVGENRIQNALPKYQEFGRYPLRWHFIGHLQTNKAKHAVKLFDFIHSVDSVSIAEKLQKEAEKIRKRQNILVEVNISREKSKFGIMPEELENLVKAIKKMDNLMLLGLMAMAPYSHDSEDSRPYFRQMRKLRQELSSYNGHNVNLRHLSMGMSADFEVAIEEGADIIRIGSAIFK